MKAVTEKLQTEDHMSSAASFNHRDRHRHNQQKCQVMSIIAVTIGSILVFTVIKTRDDFTASITHAEFTTAP
jgi:hypothetical protein